VVTTSRYTLGVEYCVRLINEETLAAAEEIVAVIGRFVVER
jgi:hypothetical protein